VSDEPPFHLLEHLASRSEQVRYIEQATKDEYLLPKELLNDALHFCERVGAFDASPAQKQAVEVLKQAIQAAPDELEAEAKLVDHPVWADIREKAGGTLVAFGQPVPD
jgi:hypothetical protein